DKLLKQPDLKTVKGIRDRAMLELMYATGMKVSELINLKVTDINLTGKYVICGEKRERIIPFGKTAKDTLMKYSNLRSELLSSGETKVLFLNSSGEPLSRQGFWKILKAYARNIGIDNINPNTIRHSFAVHLIDNGADLGSVSEFLGHSDLTTTQAYLPQSHKNAREVYMNTHPRA
ncbi:MAG: xerD, partial [Herbinix sp.]|nr:xerD [Herbinix sp.]